MEAKKRTPWNPPSYAPYIYTRLRIRHSHEARCILHTYVFSGNPAYVPVPSSVFPSFSAPLLTHTTVLPVDA